MPDPNGFLRYGRVVPRRRPVPLRLLDWREVSRPAGDRLVEEQATRCMDCGVPFCHHGCPLGNRIPDWNELVRTGAWDQAAESLHATDNFPEFTGRLCPAPCEAACVLAIGPAREPVGGAERGRGGARLEGGSAREPVGGAERGRGGARLEEGSAREPVGGAERGRGGARLEGGSAREPVGGAERGRGGARLEEGTAEPVAVKLIEVEIINRAFKAGNVVPHREFTPSGHRVAIVGSGPAGLAAAQQLVRAGHEVTVYERDDAVGGLLRYGIPDFKLEKSHVDRRLDQLVAEGVRFVTGCAVGVDVTLDEIRGRHDAVLLAAGALSARSLVDTPGGRLRGVHQAMAHLVGANRHVAGLTTQPPIDAHGRHVVIIGGGDTAADCLGVAHRQGAASVTQLDIYPQPPSTRDDDRDPWPTWPWVLRQYPAHEEGGRREFAVAVLAFEDEGRGHVRAVRIAEVTVSRQDGQRRVTPVPGTERELPADLVLLAIGFDGTEPGPLLDQAGLHRADGTVPCGPDWQTETPGVFVAGDMHRGASLVVWAIAEGRSAAAAIHTYLGARGALPVPVSPAARPLHASFR